MTDHGNGAFGGVTLRLVEGTVEVEGLGSLAFDMEESSECRHLNIGRAVAAGALLGSMRRKTEKLGQDMGKLDLGFGAFTTGVDRHVCTGN